MEKEEKERTEKITRRMHKLNWTTGRFRRKMEVYEVSKQLLITLENHFVKYFGEGYPYSCYHRKTKPTCRFNLGWEFDKEKYCVQK